MKDCPLCHRKDWNYDVVISLSGIIFCGDCWHEVKQKAYKLYGYISGYSKPLTPKQYFQALTLAQKDKT